MPVQRRNLDFETPLTSEQWAQLGESANARPDFGVLRWAPAERDVIRVALRADDAPRGWDAVASPDRNVAPCDREVARFVYTDGRPDEVRALEVERERWVRGAWHELRRDAAIHHDRGARLPEAPNAVRPGYVRTQEHPATYRFGVSASR